MQPKIPKYVKLPTINGNIFILSLDSSRQLQKKLSLENKSMLYCKHSTLSSYISILDILDLFMLSLCMSKKYILN